MADPHYENVSLLLPMNGANNGTTFTDYSSNQKTVTVVGNAKTVTAQSKYYGSSGYFDGSGDYLDIPSTTQLNGTEDFCVECYIYVSAYPSGAVKVIYSQRQAVSNYMNFELTTAGTLGLWLSSNSSYRTTIGAVPLSQWVHVALSRASNTFRCFIDGVTGFSDTVTSSLNSGGTGSVCRDVYSTGREFSGYMQDLRITRGVARYTSNFTPPAKLCGTISGTITGADDSPAQRTIIAVPRTYPTNRAWSTQSSAVDGSYSIQVPDVECSRIVLAEETELYNDIVDRVIPG